MDAPPDAELCARVQAGDGDAAAELLFRHKGLAVSYLCRVARRVKPDSLLWHEALSAASVAIWQAAMAWRPGRGTRFGTFARTGVGHAIQTVVNPRRPRLTAPLSRHLLDPGTAGDSPMDALADALALLPVDQCRAVCLLYGVGGPVHPVAAAADVMGLPPAEVRRLVGRAITALKKTAVLCPA